MIVVYHNKNKVVEFANTDSFITDKYRNLSIAESLMLLAKKDPENILVWCHLSLKEQLNISEIEQLFHHKKILLSYNPNTLFFDERIGYVEESPFIKVNKSVTFPTWQMSSAVGCIPAKVLLALNKTIPLDRDFDYFLCSLAKLSMPKGLLCYSEPQLLKPKLESEYLPIKTSPYTLFRFVKQHYRMRWIFLLLFNLLIYEQKFPFLPFIFSFFYKNRSKLNISLDGVKVQSSAKIVHKATVDVIIPTIGRKNYLYDILKDLKAQTHLPKNVIIVEQNPDVESKSELDYLTTEEWPFEIKHSFTHQAGACNARNLALNQIECEWVFLADDDIRIEEDCIQKSLHQINKFGVKAITLKCLQKGQKQKETPVFQWGTFGSGCSLIFADSLKDCVFKVGYEFGFGEDGDFGMQLRNQGCDVLFLPKPEILHLKAPIGGFRTKPVLQWHNDTIQPKPSPTVMLYKVLHNTIPQVNSYKTTLFFKYYRLQKIKNPLGYYNNFQKQWDRSVFWANELNK
ncbi:glycosyltransferase family A protein [Flavobacterium sp.]|uniref:glycosyltransferase family 2 protein n=1 Tax=Flavobacterium sp. TaxID=239 RepID=UPI002C7F7840|nr:glycosyltransferase family A protein [Flavobacterium sp.]HSD09229.1 glycosyltransferase family A protein [Flavobacterium sp.]